MYMYKYMHRYLGIYLYIRPFPTRISLHVFVLICIVNVIFYTPYSRCFISNVSLDILLPRWLDLV